MWKPLLAPAPIIILAGHGETDIEVDIAWVLATSPNAVANVPGAARAVPHAIIGLSKHGLVFLVHTF